MKSKKLIGVFVIAFAISFHISAQSSDSKTEQDLKKAENVVGKSTTLINLFKKKKKSENKVAESNEGTPNTSTNDQAIAENEEQQKAVSITTIEDKVPLSKVAAILFKNCISKSSNAEKNEITAIMNFKTTEDNSKFYIDDDYYREYPFVVEVYPIDINYDGIEEIALVYGHAAISGDNVITTLFIKDNNSHYNANFGFTGSLIILANSNKTFPNIAIGGPGFEFPVWYWDGKNYSYHSRISDETLEKSKPLFLEDGSKIYMESISN